MSSNRTTSWKFLVLCCDRILSPYDPTNASIANCDLIEEETELLQIHEGWDPFKGPSGEVRENA